MTDVQRKMRAIAEQGQQSKQRKADDKKRQQSESDITLQAMCAIFEQLCNEWVAGDERLHLNPVTADSPAFSIEYRKRTHSVTPTLLITGTCKGSNVEVQISDGKWEQVKGVLGSWGDWADERTVYSGKLCLEDMQSAIEPAFLQWYKEAIDAPDEHPDT
ncbi:MAG: hypothetical protein OWT28_11000 [Firmicutes bacterium]|nr:hypothetical protein [Bacillota bacterium]